MASSPMCASTMALGDAIATIAEQLASGTARMLRLLAEFDAREGYLIDGQRSTADWLAWRCGIAAITAREHVRVARTLLELPATADAFERGRVSYSKVRSITRIATPGTEQELLTLARSSTAAQLEELVSRHRREAALATPGHAHRHRSVHWFHDDEGMLTIRARLAPEDGEVVVRALQRAIEDEAPDNVSPPGPLVPPSPLVPPDAPRVSAGTQVPDPLVPLVPPIAPHVSAGTAAPAPLVPPDRHTYRFDEPLSSRQRAADALVAIAEGYLDSIATPTPRTPSDRAASRLDRALIWIRADEAALMNRSGRAELMPERIPVGADALRRIACDARVIRQPAPGMTIGRSRRSVPDGMRRAIIERDRGCRFPGCRNKRADAHHITHWADGGATATSNLVLLCRRHHRHVHEDGFTIELDASTADVRVRRPDGALLSAGRSGLGDRG